MEKCQVSVIIPAYKPEFIVATLKSVLSQTYKNIEVIVVNDGSPFELENILKPYIENKSIRYICQENKMMGAAKNNGINHSIGEFIAFVDDDDLWTDDKIEKQIKMFQDKDVGMVYSWADEYYDGLIRPRDDYKNRVARGMIFDQIFLDNFIPSSSVVVRRECLDVVGYFNETKDYYGIDDYDLWLRIAYKYKIDLVNEPLLKIRIHDKQVSGKAKYMILQELNIKNTLIATFKIQKKLSRKAYSHLYFRMGYLESTTEKNHGKALKYFIKSSLYHISLVHVKEIVKNLFPQRIIESLKRMLCIKNLGTYSPPH